MNPFKYESKSKIMNPKLAILLIIIAGGISATAYATTTIISDSGIITSNLTITGTCTGCGAGEGDFNSYAVIYNSTFATISPTGLVKNTAISNDGSFFIIDNNDKIWEIAANKTIIINANVSAATTGTGFQSGQSMTGEYKFVYDDSFTLVHIIKNNNLIQTSSLDKTQFQAFGPNSFADSSMSMSPNGKYIEVAGPNNGDGLLRVVILQGS